ncbi:hypothetical protein Tco_1414181 [Tanacetum coccineum]
MFLVYGDAEYIAAFDALKEAVWIRKFIYGLGVVPIIEEPINMYCDNTVDIAIEKDHGVTKGARHFRAKVHYLRETIEVGDVRIEKVNTDDNLADPFTKALAFPKHSELIKKIGMIPASSHSSFDLRYKQVLRMWISLFESKSNAISNKVVIKAILRSDVKQHSQHL